MAALNTLRTKGGVVLAVVIGISLLAFLLGDLTNSGGSLFGPTAMNVGEINSTEVSVQEYSNGIEQTKVVQQMLTGSQNQNEEQMQSIRTQTWDRFIRKYSFTPSFEALGLVVSEDEKVDMAAGEYVSPVLQSIFADPSTGVYNREAVKGFLTNIDQDPSGRSAQFWSIMEEEIVDERAFSKYFALVKNGINVTPFEVEQMAALNNSNSNISFVNKAAYQVADSLVSVSDSDVQAYYNEHKNEYRDVEGRELTYVLFEALPSETDYSDAKEYFTQLTKEFCEAEDVARFVSLNSESDFDATFKKASEFDGDFQGYLEAKDRETVYGPILEGDHYTASRVLDSKMLPDSLGAKHILVAATQGELADSLLKVLKKDKSKFTELAAQFSLDQSANAQGGDLGIFNMNQMVPEFAAAVAASKKGEVILVNTQFGTHIVEVTFVGPKSQKYQVATLDYSVEPSNQTEQAAYAKASEFASKVAASTFDAVVAEDGLSKRVARLNAGDRDIQGVESSTELVRWAFDNEKDAVSEVITIGDGNYVAKIETVREHGITPLAQVESEIRSALLNEKKVDYMANQIKDLNTLDQMAKVLDVEVANAENVNFQLYYIPDLGVAPAVVGAVSALENGAISAPINNNGSLSVVKIDSKTDAENISLEDQKARLDATATTAIEQRVMSAVYSLADIKDNRVKFF